LGLMVVALGLMVITLGTDSCNYRRIVANIGRIWKFCRWLISTSLKRVLGVKGTGIAGPEGEDEVIKCFHVVYPDSCNIGTNSCNIGTDSCNIGTDSCNMGTHGDQWL